MASGTPSTQVQIPVGDLISPAPLMLIVYYLGEIYPAAAE